MCGTGRQLQHDARRQRGTSDSLPYAPSDTLRRHVRDYLTFRVTDLVSNSAWN